MFSKINLNITKKNIIPVPWKGEGVFGGTKLLRIMIKWFLIVLNICLLFFKTETLYQTQTINITTPGNSTRISLAPYGLNATGRTSLTFRVRACGPASIILTDVETNAPVSSTSEFIFGNKDNTKCEFKADIFTKFSYPCSSLCNDSNEYWISWGDDNDDLIQEWRMGRGTVVLTSIIGTNPFNFRYPEYISISSENYPADWQFGKNIIWFFLICYDLFHS